MELSTAWNSRASAISFAPLITLNTCGSSHFQHPSLPPQRLSFPFCPYPFRFVPSKSLTLQARKRNSEPEQQPLVSPTIIEEVSEDDEDDDDVILDDFDDEASVEDDYYGDESAADEAELYDGDGGGGGGISLAGTWWDEKALGIAEEVILTFEGDLKIYAFKTLPNFNIQVRIEKLSNKSGSPSMEDIEAFSRTYRTRLDEAELARSVPENLCLEVSSPGVERVVRIPQDLDRYKDRPMYVKYVTETDATGSISESDGVFRLVSFDMETKCCIWGVADVRINREKAGKGDHLTKSSGSGD